MLDEFIEQIMREADFPDTLDEEERTQIKKDMVNRANDMMNYAIVDSMSPELQKQFEELVSREDVQPQAITEFIEQNVPDRQKIATNALVEFRAAFLGL